MHHEPVADERVGQRLGEVIDHFLTRRLQRGEPRRERFPIRAARAIAGKPLNQGVVLRVGEEPDLVSEREHVVARDDEIVIRLAGHCLAGKFHRPGRMPLTVDARRNTEIEQHPLHVLQQR